MIGVIKNNRVTDNFKYIQLHVLSLDVLPAELFLSKHIMSYLLIPNSIMKNNYTRITSFGT